ncbi:hypothetical protein SOVF_205890 [Spinacia oleracea]|nr:hypothetical protein SOVF_205890 [Spinacia oleracea]
MVAKLTKDVHSSVVETKDWEVVEIVGTNTSYDSLDIFGCKIKGQDLNRIAINLCKSRLWVNMEGISFIRLGVMSLSLHVVFYQSNELFDWARYGVKKTDPNTAKSDDDGKSLEDLKKELKEYKDKLKEKEKEIKEGKSAEDFKKIEKELKDKKDEVLKFTKDGKQKDSDIIKLKDDLKKSNDKNKEHQKTAKKTKDDLDAKIKKLEGTITNNSSAITQYDQVLHKWRRPVLSIRFNTLSSYNSNLYYSPDLNSMPTYKPVDEIVLNRYPSGINVWVSSGSFEKDNWWFIKRKDENGSYESLFAFYGGVYDNTSTTYGGTSINVKIPYSNGATFRSNVRFLVVALRGYGSVFGFCY